MRRTTALLGLMGAVLLLVGPGARPAAAEDGDAAPVEAVVTQEVPPSADSPNYVPVVVMVFDQATKQPAAGSYDVLLTVEDEAGNRSVAFPCTRSVQRDPTAPGHRYECTGIVDHGGRWVFGVGVHQVVFDTRLDIGGRLGQGSVTLDVDAPTLEGIKRNEFLYGNIHGNIRDPLVLAVHSLVGIAWMGCLGLLVALALPGARRLLSETTLHAVETRWTTLVRTTGALVAATVGSGIYLVQKSTAYPVPWSASSRDGILRLPYAQPYLLFLVTKVAVYAGMVVASVVVINQARRATFADERSATGDVEEPPVEWDDVDDIYATPATGAGTVTLLRQRTAGMGRISTVGLARSARLVQLAAVVLLVGAAAIFGCVTMLKYLHELAEASRALANNLTTITTPGGS